MLISFSSVVFDGYYPGGEAEYSGVHLSESAPDSIGTNYFQYMVYNDTTWDWETLTYDDVLTADSINPGQINAVDPDLSSYVSRGGKVLHYMGWMDPNISPGQSVSHSLP